LRALKNQNEALQAKLDKTEARFQQEISSRKAKKDQDSANLAKKDELLIASQKKNAELILGMKEISANNKQLEKQLEKMKELRITQETEAKVTKAALRAMERDEQKKQLEGSYFYYLLLLIL